MKDRLVELYSLGWSDWFEQRIECKTGDVIARVAAVDREQLLLVDHSGFFRAKLAGSYLHRHRFSHELPCVGDWVCVEKQPVDGFGVVHALVERRTWLRRKYAGTVIDYQMIAANIDYVVIVQSCHFDFNLNRLERYLVMVADGGAESRILLTKTDLVQPAILERQIVEIQSVGIKTPLFTLSNTTGDGVDDFKRLLLPGKTYCFVGSSGVGKSTLLNKLMGCEKLETADVSGTGEGLHTTVRRELIRLDGGALVIDNPGMREFGILAAGEIVGNSFSDIAAISSHCRYRDCSHTNEPGCAVIEAVNSGEIDQEHFENFLKLRNESAYNQMSYVDKRKKDRAFGRFIKSVQKGLKNKC